jgi:hypothetical protein
VASFFKRLKRKLLDDAVVRARVKEHLAAPDEVDREVVIHKPRAIGPTVGATAVQVATLAAMLGHALLRGVKGEKRG